MKTETPAQTSVEQHLRSASDAILLLVGEVRQLEEHKRGVQPGNKRFDELATAVRVAAQELADFAAQEEVWAHRADDVAAATTISDTSSPPELAAILARWRMVERSLSEAQPGSPDAERLFEQFEQIRDEYMAAFNAKSGGT